MHRFFRHVGLVAVVSLLGACFDPGTAQVNDDDAAADDAPETPIADSLKQPIDRAKAVEDMAMERKAEMDKRLEEMEGASEDVDP